MSRFVFDHQQSTINIFDAGKKMCDEFLNEIKLVGDRK